MSLPTAPPIKLSANSYIQPPLSRRGHGPGLIVLLPHEASYPHMPAHVTKPLDPEPVLKWAEEGFAVLAVRATSGEDTWGLKEVFDIGVANLKKLNELDNKDSLGLVVYDSKLASALETFENIPTSIKCLVSYGSPLSSLTIPTLSHLPSDPASKAVPSSTLQTGHSYVLPSPEWHFILPSSSSYHPPTASIAHTRSLVFIKSHLGGPYFDIEAVWEEHTLYEFEQRSVEKTMATMVAEPYVNHVPTMTGGMGRKALTAFYRDHFIFANPPDTTLVPISRTVGPDRIVDEFIFTMTHDREVPWFLPGVPASHKKFQIPFIGVINMRGDRLYHEHIWWDQATALRQAGVLPEWVDYHGGLGEPSSEGIGPGKKLRLPVSGAECAKLLADETDGESNGMFGKDWGVHDA